MSPYEIALYDKGYRLQPDGSWSRPPRPRDTRTDPELERDTCHEPLETAPVQKGASGKVLVLLTSFRRRLLDEDNLCEKYHVDCCRYAGLIRADDPGSAKIQICQEKVGSGQAEFVRIEITPL